MALVYKYTPSIRLEGLLKSGTVAFPLASQLNDPFESSVESAAARILEGHATVRIPGLWWRPGSLSYLMGTDGKTPTENAGRAFRLLNRFRGDVGVLSLTSEPLSVLMWSHYAENGAGVCVGFDADDEWFARAPASLSEMSSLFCLREVQYSASFPSVGSDREAEPDYPERVVEAAFFTKYGVWSYEQEIRLLRPVAGLTVTNGIALDAIPLSAIREVIVGPRATPETLTMARTLSSALRGCVCRRAECKPSEYAMNLV